MWLSVPASPGGRSSLRWGVVWGSPWAVFPPPFLFFICLCCGCLFLAFPVGTLRRLLGGRLWVLFSVLSCCGQLVVAVTCSGRGPLGLRFPPPLSFFFAVLVVSASPWFFSSSPPRVCASVSGVSFPPALRWLRRGGGLLFLARRRRAGQGGLSVSYRWVPWASPTVLPGLECCPSRWSGCVVSRLYGCPSRFPLFPLAGGSAVSGL